MNKISELRATVQKHGSAVIDIDEYNQLQNEWITRCVDDETIAATIATLQAQVVGLKEENVLLIKANIEVAEINATLRARIEELENPDGESQQQTAKMLSGYTLPDTDNYLLAGIVYDFMQGKALPTPRRNLNDQV